MDLDLAQVRAFATAAETGNFTRAAAELNLTQQALSKRIGRLEATLGPLFRRTAAGVELTWRGRNFVRAAQDLIAAADIAFAVGRGGRPPALRVDVWGAHHPVALLVETFARLHPQAVVESSMRRSLPQAVRALTRHEIDIAAGNRSGLPGTLPSGLTAELVTCSPISALMHRTHPLAQRTALTRDDLRSARLWWPLTPSSDELSAFVAEYARWLDVALSTAGRNVGGLDMLVGTLQDQPDRITFVDRDWVVGSAEVKMVPLTPTPLFPWFVIWPTQVTHPLVPALLNHLRTSGFRPAASDFWLPRAARELKVG